MTKVLYRKYRPSNFGEVVGQEHVVKTLKNAIKRGKIAHAYLFSGPRGIGKTTIARILAKAVNCENIKDGEPCNECLVCKNINQNKFLDLVEIDAATHTQVDKIRDIIEKINFSPAIGKYKVYIIDEVHMLSKGAFNALLKTLEEPPQHVIFILATTEIHKIPATIISRCQRFDFRRIKISEIKKRLEGIAEKEKVKVGKGVFDFIAVNSSGGMRDSESLFGQILALEDKEITLKEVQEILALADISKTIELVKLIIEKKYSEAVGYVSKTIDDGYDLEQFSESVVEYCRKLMLIKISPEIKNNFSLEMTEEQIAELEDISQKTAISEIVKMIRVFIQAREEIKSSIIPQLPLELAIAEINISNNNLLTNRANNDYNDKIKEPIKKIATKVSQSVKQSQDFIKKSVSFGKKEMESETELSSEISEPSSVSGNDIDDIDLNVIKGNWSRILEEIKPHNHSLTVFLKTCCPIDARGNKITMLCQYSFHKDKLNKIENKLIIEKVASQVLGSEIFTEFITNNEAEKMGYKIKEDVSVAVNNSSDDGDSDKKENDNKNGDMVDSALEMFGGKVI
ncbi:MAG: DNA polymerase III subunit gamma/tau [Patescibacteria group bacterium]|nr:DNA polymerase III subunit gamma/tau [Patescibacteria group bacterium]